MKILLAKLMALPQSAMMELQAPHLTSHCKQQLAHRTKCKKTTVFRHCTIGRAGLGLLRKGKHKVSPAITPNLSAALMSWGDGGQNLDRLRQLKVVGPSSGKREVAQSRSSRNLHRGTWSPGPCGPGKENGIPPKLTQSKKTFALYRWNGVLLFPHSQTFSRHPKEMRL